MNNMNFILFSSICVAIVITTEAADSIRRLRIRNFNKVDSIICSYVSSGVYETKVVSKFTGMLYISYRHAVKGDCSSPDVCQGLCTVSGAYDISNRQCRCRPQILSAATIPTTKISNADRIASTTAAPVSTPISSAPVSTKPTSAPTASPTTLKPFSAPTTAPIIARAAAPVPETKTIFCSNPYGNPCGPGSACTDTETGITCAPINLAACPVGCGPNSTCMMQPNMETYECMCNGGFSRPQPFLPCIADP